MKHLRETFTDEEWKILKAAKKRSGKNWHDLILWAIPQAVDEFLD
jgi:hypothetical protein